MNLPNLERILSNPDKHLQQKAIDIMDNAKREEQLKEKIEKRRTQLTNSKLHSRKAIQLYCFGIEDALRSISLLQHSDPEIMKQAGWVREKEIEGYKLQLEDLQTQLNEANQIINKLNTQHP